jgi:2-dehydro-3-deoxyphosphooctonate aldolase (KDO 8-P synthase)
MAGFWQPAPVVVAGPCLVESDSLNVSVARQLVELSEKLGFRAIFKASFDKANRSAPNALRGPGMQAGLDALTVVKEETGLAVITDVHEPWQLPEVAPRVDALQIPAFLCRQTDLLIAAGREGKPVNIKKGQWMSAESMAGAVQKVVGSGCDDVAVTERGTFFGYGDLVVDMRNFTRMRAATGKPVLFDATHSVQQPGLGVRGSSGGLRQHVPDLLVAAAAAGADGFFLETHPTPEDAPSDAVTMWPLADLEELLARALEVWRTARAEVECSNR